MKSPFEILYRLPKFAGFLAKKPAFPLKVVEHHARLARGKGPLIRAIEYAVTYDCQASCAKCSAAHMRDPARPLLTDQQVRQLGDDCHRLGAYEVNLTGGEPLLVDDLEEVVDCFNPRSTFIGVNTNGRLLSRRRILSLRDAGADLIKISLDSPVASEHDASRGLEGLYDHVMDMLRVIREVRGVRGHLCMVSTREAIESGAVQQVLDIAKDNNATLGIVLPAAIGGWTRKHEVLLQSQHRRLLDRFSTDPAVFLQGNVGQREFVCPCGTTEIYINCYGDVIPCPFIQIAFGNVRDEQFSSIYERMASWKQGAGGRPVCSSAEDPEFFDEYVKPMADASSSPVPYEQHPAWKKDRG